MVVRLSIIVLLAASTVEAQTEVDRRPTIPEIVARQAPGPVLSTIQRELLAPLPLSELAPKADLIVQGILQLGQTYLSADQRDLYTDYVLTPTRIFVQRSGVIVAPVPGVASTFTVTRRGGHTVINGVQFTLEDLDLPAFKSGDEVILFLVYDTAERKYQLAQGIEGAFAVRGNRVESLLKHSGDLLPDLPVTEFTSEISRSLAN